MYVLHYIIDATGEYVYIWYTCCLLASNKGWPVSQDDYGVLHVLKPPEILCRWQLLLSVSILNADAIVSHIILALS